ncbi:MAG TPA: hypothetical protein VFT74_16060 [Isosphaeraceae bacterium]|nr:hypothetical protein [Isosphaeraceae bacterium]
MNPSSDASRSTLIQVTILGPQSSDEEPACPHCSNILDRHQPDVQRCETMLGTCSECGDWYLVVHDPSLNQTWLTHLPLSQLRTAPMEAGEVVAKPKRAARRSQRSRSELRAG